MRDLYHNLTCTAVRSDRAVFAIGFNNGVLRLWARISRVSTTPLKQAIVLFNRICATVSWEGILFDGEDMKGADDNVFYVQDPWRILRCIGVSVFISPF